ncbi:nucleoside recognition domain-containing protein [Thermoproteota archaeon]
MTEEIPLEEEEKIIKQIRKKKLFPKNIKQVFSKSLKSSLKVSWLLLKIYIPLSIITIFLKQIGVIDWIAPFLAPFMGIMGLPGEAAITLIAGMTNGILGALGTMAAFDLTFRQITILGVVVGLAHNLFVETGILTKLKMATVRIAVFRIVIAVFAGILMNLFMPKTISGIVLNPYIQPEFSWLATFQSLLMTSIQIIVVLFIITLAYELLMLWKYTSIIKKKVNIIPKAIGFGDTAFGPLIIGFFVGIAYGAGILFQFAEKNILSHKDACLTTIFLCLAHAIIEDTVLFVVVGGNFWWIILIRVTTAFLVVRLLSINDLYKKFLWIGLPKK